MKSLAFLLLISFSGAVCSEETFQYTLTSKCVVFSIVEKSPFDERWQIVLKIDNNSAEELQLFTEERVGHFFEFVDDNGDSLGIPGNKLHAPLYVNFRLFGFDNESKALKYLGLINKGTGDCRPYLASIVIRR